MRALWRRTRYLGETLLGVPATLSLRRAILGPFRLRVLGPAYRRVALRRVMVVGITGTAAKTTTKELVAAVLASSFRVQKSRENLNLPNHLVGSLLGVRPSDDVFVAEIAAANRSDLVGIEGMVRMLRPRIGVVTTVGMEHVGAFSSLDAVAAEKGKLVALLPPDGTAVLNADDPHVLAMQARCPGRRVLTYGTAAGATLRAEDARGAWPDRLSFTVVHDGRSYPVHTQLCGTHFVSAVLAALAVGVAMRVPLARAIEAVSAVAPFPGRLSPITTPDGVTFIHDDVKAPVWSLGLAFGFMKDARAPRKIIVVGTLSDYVGDSGGKYVAAAKQALEAADVVMFVGPNASKALKARSQHPRGDALSAVASLDAARQRLARVLRPGDLVLLKGSVRDHLERLGDVRIAQTVEVAAGARPCSPDAEGSPIRLIVGLGNPGASYEDTPHNVGHRALDLLVASLGGSFEPDDEALVARCDLPDARCYFVKTSTLMNATGPVVLRLAERLGAEPRGVILIHDDIDLPVGAVRTRMSGSDGGHRGVRSVLEAFQTFEICRVKIGVGRPRRPGEAASHVLRRLDPDALPAIDRACELAATRVRELAGIVAATHQRV